MWSAFVALIVRLFSLFIQRKSPTVVEGEQYGSATQQVSDLKALAKTQAAIADAEANAPQDAAGVVSRLEQGRF